MNFLEQLIAEWYEYKGYFVRRNVLVGRRAKGGYESELDIVAFNPFTKHLIHIEPSMDADSWAVREKRFKNKFDAGRKHIPSLFKGLHLPNDIDQVAILVLASKANHTSLGGARLRLIDELIEEIFNEFRNMHLASNAIPEHLTVLRSFQFVVEYKKTIYRALEISD